MKCDIFISYRRDGGDMTAMYIYQALKERGYNVLSRASPVSREKMPCCLRS